MPSPTVRIQRALTARLIELLPAERVGVFVGTTHTETLRDNVVPSVTDEQLEILRAQLAAGDGGELRPRPKSGKTTAHAPYSSATLALNAFGGWLGHEPLLSVAGRGAWTEPLQIEAKLQISHGGGRANLDAFLASPGRVLGIESKLSEYVAGHAPRHLKAVYATEAMASLLPTGSGWHRVLVALLDGELACSHLDPEQLVKHALALQSRFPDAERTLAYVYWEPANATEIPECRAHRDELAGLVELLGDDDDPAFIALTYDELFAEWAALGDASAAARTHVAALRARYGDVEV